MSKPERIDNAVLSAWPKVFRQGNEIFIKTRIMTPLRLSGLQQMVFLPLTRLLVVAAIVCGVDWVLMHFKVYSLIRQFPYGHIGFLVLLVVLAGLGLAEWFAGYPVCRKFLGRRLVIRYKPKTIEIKVGWKTRRFERQHQYAFTHTPIRVTSSTIYQNARIFSLIVDDMNRIELSEMYDLKLNDALVTNANAALLLDPLFSPNTGIETDFSDQVREQERALEPKQPRALWAWLRHIPFLKKLV